MTDQSMSNSNRYYLLIYIDLIDILDVDTHLWHSVIDEEEKYRI